MPNESQKERSLLIKRSLEEHLEKELSSKLHGIDAASKNNRPFSTIIFWRAKTEHGVQRFVSKTIEHHPINKAITEKENQAVVEYNILKFLYQKYQNVNNCSVPRPILVMPEKETYLMEFVDGTLLSDQFRYARYFSNKKNFNVLRSQIFNCGKWLKNFQKITGLKKMGPEALRPVIERCDERLRLIEASKGPRCPGNLREKVLGEIDNHLKKISKNEVLVSGSHSDFTPINILVNSSHVTVIDFLGYNMNPVPVDLFKFLVFLENDKNSLFSSRSRQKKIRDSFIAGYGQATHIPLSVLIICEILQRVVSLWGCISTPPKKIHHIFETNNRIKEHVDWLLTGEKKDSVWPQRWL